MNSKTSKKSLFSCRKNIAVFLSCAGLVGASNSAHADFYNWGKISFSADATVTESYDDNIFSDQTGAVDDYITNVDASLMARYRDMNNIFDLTLSGDGEFYSDNTSEDNNGHRIIADWRHTFSDSFSINPKYTYRSYTSSRGNPFDDPGRVAQDSAENQTHELELDAYFQKSIYSLDFGGSAYKRNTDNVLRNNGELIVNSANNHSDVELYVKPGLIVLPNTKAYIKAEYLQRKFEHETSSAAHNTTGYTGVAGLEYIVPGFVTFDAFAGYLEHKYASTSLEETNIPHYGLNFVWRMSDRLSTQVTGTRALSVTSSATTSAILTDTARVNVTYMPMDKLELAVGGSFSDRDYEDSASATDGADRKDEYYTASFDVTYSLTENFDVGAGYEYRNRNSNATDASFDRNITSLFLKASF